MVSLREGVVNIEDSFGMVSYMDGRMDYSLMKCAAQVLCWEALFGIGDNGNTWWR